MLNMKKAILSPLCSALVIPGLGQVINQHLKKGVAILAAVFVLLVGFTVHLYRVVQTVMMSGSVSLEDPASVVRKVMEQGASGLGVLLALFGLLWLYAVVDAFFGGM